jgi:hypothetical protein
MMCEDEAKQPADVRSLLVASSEYDCSFRGEPARLSLFVDAAQMETSMRSFVRFLGTDAPPMVCGDAFSVELSTEGNRDAVLDRLRSAGLSVQRCP